MIRISFGAGVVKSRAELTQRIHYQLRQNLKRLAISDQDQDDMPACFADLIQQAADKYQRPVVILVDEYDKPMLDSISDDAVANEIRDDLRGIYSVIKDNDACIRFAFLTGVSKFSKVSVFSGLNNLEDLTLDARYSALCGYTQTELEYYFAEHLQDADLQQVENWYNGYNWLGESVYNPFDILLFIRKRLEFLPYWFETGTPNFFVFIGD